MEYRIAIQARGRRDTLGELIVREEELEAAMRALRFMVSTLMEPVGSSSAIKRGHNLFFRDQRGALLYIKAVPKG